MHIILSIIKKNQSTNLILFYTLSAATLYIMSYLQWRSCYWHYLQPLYTLCLTCNGAAVTGIICSHSIRCLEAVSNTSQPVTFGLF